jgi:small conductance mechanosensitive channel
VLGLPAPGNPFMKPGMYSTLVQRLRERAVKRARGAGREALLLVPLIAAVALGYTYRDELFGIDKPIRFLSVLAFVILGWALVRDLGRAAGPLLYKRLAPPTAGIVDFVIRLGALTIVVLVALYAAALPPKTLAVGGAVAAAILGLAAQQTLGNLVAGLVILSARPFRLGDRIRLRGGDFGDEVEGIVSSLGLLYTTLTPTRESLRVPRGVVAQDEGNIMVPNNLVIGSAVVPGGQPPAVALRARLKRGVKATEVQERLEQGVSVPTRTEPEIALEVGVDEVSVVIEARPEARSDGPQLTDEILGAIDDLMSQGEARVDSDRAAA